MDTGYWVVLIAAAAGLIQGFSGFGAAAVAVPLFALVLDLPSSVALITLLGILIGAMNVWVLRAHLRRGDLARLLASALLGVPFGVMMLTRLPERWVLLVLAAVLIGYGLFGLRGGTLRWLGHPLCAYPVGALAGWLGASVGVNGPPVIVYTAGQGWSAAQKKGTLAGFFLVTSVMSATGHAVSGLTSEAVLGYFALAAVPLVATTLLGIRLFERMPANGQRQLTHLLILFLGLLLAWEAWA